ncbi:MAG: hypothetical protein K2P88_04165 [Chitinophagaceae bacterium]|jgi:cytochrome b561|uniref:hypothetical protein n=1 Tax=unclassified Paraflavitalea TaxID=2798305 RepID=UPI003D335455|nr:hypothetical protein [Chitinophagaceae bacterium]
MTDTTGFISFLFVHLIASLLAVFAVTGLLLRQPKKPMSTWLFFALSLYTILLPFFLLGFKQQYNWTLNSTNTHFYITGAFLTALTLRLHWNFKIAGALYQTILAMVLSFFLTLTWAAPEKLNIPGIYLIVSGLVIAGVLITWAKAIKERYFFPFQQSWFWISMGALCHHLMLLVYAALYFSYPNFPQIQESFTYVIGLSYLLQWILFVIGVWSKPDTNELN